MQDELQTEYDGRHYLLRRKQWNGRVAKISACDELLEEVKKYCWTLRGSGEHPYLSTRSNGHLIYLHAFVFRWLYGEEQFAKMTKDLVIDHLDNDGLNCCFENLCLSTDTDNVIKGRGIDNGGKLKKIPDYIINVFYLHEQHIHQMQIVFNRIKLGYKDRRIARLYLSYKNHGTMISDWYYLVNCLRDEIEADFFKLRQDMYAAEYAAYFPEVPAGQNFVEENGGIFARLNPDAGDNAIFIVKSELQPIRWDAVEENQRKAREKLPETEKSVSEGNTNI